MSKPTTKKQATRKAGKTKTAPALTFDALTDAALAPVEFSLNVGGNKMPVTLLPLTATQWDEVAAYADVKPPALPNAKPGDMMALDWDDPTFIKDRRKGDRLAHTAMIVASCPALTPAGKDLHQQADLMHDRLPASLIEQLVHRIRQISKPDISGDADFFTGSD